MISMDDFTKIEADKIFIPEHLSDIPKAVYLDKVVVTFICKDGDPQHGNVAVSIKLSS